MNDFADSINDNLDLTVVLADLQSEYYYDKNSDRWIVAKCFERWKGKRDEKLDWIELMIADRHRLWIVESARYFGGLHHEFIGAFKKHYGGLRFIIPVTDEWSARQFLIDRCEKRNKKFRADYWTKKRLTYEARDRYLNVAKKHYMPSGVKCFIQPIFYEREEWIVVARLMREILQLSSEAWYE
jgi:hypothetical protein